MANMYDVDTPAPNDIPAVRTLTLSNGNKLHIKRTDPWGLYTINYDKGQVPNELKGDFTSHSEAMKAINTYLDNRNKELATSPKPLVEKQAKV